MTSDLPPAGGSQPPPEPPSAGPSGPAPAAGSAPDGPTGSPTAPPGWSGHGSTGHGTTGHGTDEFFDRIRSAGVSRPDEGRWIAGVAAALSRRWDIDPILIRGVFVALSIFGGVGVVFYGLAWLLLPQDDGRIHLQQAIRGDITAGFIGALLLSLAAIGGGGHGPWDDGGWFFPGGLLITAGVIFAIWWLARRNSDNGGTAGPPPGSKAYSPPPVYGSPTTSSHPQASAYPQTGTYPQAGYGSTGSTASDQSGEAARQARQAEKAQAQAANAARAQELARAAKERRARTGPSKVIVRLSLGVALLTAAAILLIGHGNDWSEPVGLIAAASALVVIAAGVIASGLSGRRASGLAGIGLLLAIGVLAGAGAENAGIRTDQNLTLIGQRNWEPRTPEAAQNQFNLGVGEATLWLTDPAILGTASTSNPLDVRARVGAGHLTVVVPDNVTTQIDLVVGAGEVSYPDGTSYRFDRRNDNFDSSERRRLITGPTGEPRMVIDIRQGAGQLDIRTASGVAVTTVPSSTATATPAAPTAPAPSTAPVPTVTASN